MAIWFQPLTALDLTARSHNTLAHFLGIEFTVIGDDFMTATMPVLDKVKQPMGIVHGGGNVVLAETVASTAANAVVDFKHYYCVGLEINANHLRPVREGMITATTYPLHLGKTTQVWQIDLFNDEGKRSCVSRMTASVIRR